MASFGYARLFISGTRPFPVINFVHRTQSPLSSLQILPLSVANSKHVLILILFQMPFLSGLILRCLMSKTFCVRLCFEVEGNLKF